MAMVWWQRTRNDVLAARVARPTDRPALADLLSRAVRVFGTLAVEEHAALLNSGISSFGLIGDRPVAFLGLHQRAAADGERWADVSLVASVNGGVDRALGTLLAGSLPALRARQVTGLICVTGDLWLHNALLAAGFVEADRVITYVRKDRPVLTQTRQPSVLRPAGPAEANTVLVLNAAAFAPIWRYDDATTLSWLLTADHSMLAEVEGRAVAFALTSCSPGDGYAQLIRIGTRPQWHNHGIGRQLVVDAIDFGHKSRAAGVALNTQLSNATSRHLYEALGFQVVGPALDLLLYHIA
jgi:ribosomal protein S18 acetylase RimI-like enzyme